MDLVNLMKSMSVSETEELTPESNFNVFASEICGIHTEFVYGEFVNKYMVIAVQFGKIGGLFKVTVDEAADGVNISEPVYNVSVAFGADNIEQQAAARYIAQSLGIRKPLLLFLSLKNYDRDNVKGVADALVNRPDKDAPVS